MELGMHAGRDLGVFILMLFF